MRPADARLVAYVALREEQSGIDSVSLRQYLQDILPDYLVPNAVILLDAIPLNANGKLDKDKLPLPPGSQVDIAPDVGAEPVAAAVLATWMEVLGRNNIPSNINFFDLGGDSLLLARMVQLLNARLGLDLSFVQVLRHPTVDGLTRRVELLKAESAMSGQTRAAGREHPKRSSGKGLWTRILAREDVPGKADP